MGMQTITWHPAGKSGLPAPAGTAREAWHLGIRILHMTDDMYRIGDALYADADAAVSAISRGEWDFQ